MASSSNVNTTSQRANSSNALQLATSMNQTNRFDTQAQAELLILFQQYLGTDPKYKEVAAKLQEALETNQVLPVRYDIEGNAHPRTLASFLENVRKYSTSLPDMFQRLCQLQSKFAPPPVRGLPIRFFTSRKTALDRKTNEKFVAPPLIQSIICTRPSPVAMQSMHPVKFLLSRELGRNMPLLPKQMFRKEYMQTLNRHARIMGHLSSIFCVAFDRSGRYVFTGADDNLIKCWDVYQYLLRFTFRGHIGEISDLSVSHENSMLASGSVDKTVRIWSLRNGSTIRVYRGHSATINSIAFVPLFFEGSDLRYIVSAGNDCAVVFHRYNETTKHFLDPPFKFNERATGGARIISSSHSPGGNIVIMGDTHQAIIVYQLNEDRVDRLYEFTAHSDRVDTLVWAHNSLRFASGSKDGSAKAWSISGGQWTSRELVVPNSETTSADGMNAADGHRHRTANSTQTARKNAQNAYKVTMLTWSLDDDLVISIGSDYLLRTWDWKTGTMLGKFDGHQNETFSLMAHPLHRELVVSAGHDGLIIVWNIYTGKKLCRHRNVNNNREAVAIFDMAIGPDGSTVCCVDSMGCLGIYGVSNNQFAMTRPHEQFFSTDYRLIQIDADGRATDDDTGLLPELLGPPFFVTSNGDLHPEKEQRLVPGNDIKSNDIVKPCAWLKRDIIGPLRPSIVEKYKNEQIEHCRLEQIEFERDQMLVSLQPNAVQQIIIPVEQMNTRQRRPTNSSTTRTRGAGRSAELRQLAEYIMQNPVPRYVLDEDYTDDENDRSFSLGSDEEEEEGEDFVSHDANRVAVEHGEDESASSDGGDGEEGEEVAENGEEDENDSDYEVGRHEHATVFRERSTWTVTGKRKRRPPGAVELEQSSSSQDRLAEENRYRSERLRSRAIARAALLDASEPTSSSAALAQTAIRRIRTRRTAFIASSDGEDTGELKIGPKKEERKKKRGRKVRSGKLGKRRRIQRRIQIEHDDGEEDLIEEEDEIGWKSTRKLAKRRGNRMASGQQMSEDEAAENSFGDNVGRLYPDWMRKTKRGRFPFIPQLGDLVVYFQQGHRAYFDELKKRKIRVPSQFDVQSFLDVQEICYIDEIKYTILRKAKQQIHVADLRLARTKSNKRCGTSFHICYHDMEDSIDFLVLKEHFDASMAMKLTDGDRIESIVDEEIYTGIVTKIDAYEPEYPNSEWSSVSVCWDNGDTDRFNPWDLQKSARTRRTTKTVATLADLDKLGEYHPEAGDWLVPDEILGDSSPAKAQQLYLDRAKLAINQLNQLNCLKEFVEPVNLEVYTNYVDIVVYPIDLHTISERIHHHFYRRSLSFLSDVQYLAKNADKFNDPNSEIGEFIQHNAIILVETIFRFMENWNEKNARDLFNRFGEYDLHKLQAWKRRLHPACSKIIGGGISGDDDQLLRRLSNRSSNGAMESTSAAANQPGTSGTQKLQKSTRAARTTKNNEMPLWTVECNDMVDHLHNIFMNGVNNRDMNNSAYAFICNLRSKTDSLLQKCRKPESFLNQIREFLTSEKNRVNDAESRRSKTYQAILNMELHLDTSKQQIMAKYNRMMAEAESRQKRKAAVTAQLQWRHLDDEDEEEEEIYVKKRPKTEPVDESVSSDELSDEEEMDVDKKEDEDGVDSDFEVGRHDRGSALIGKRNRQPPLVSETHYRSRLRTRAAADVLFDPPQPSSSSAVANATYTSSGRRIKPTRRGSFVGSSDGDDGEFEEQRTSKKKRKIN